MAAYVISEVEVLNEEPARTYRDLAGASIERYGGRYLARGAEAQVLEGAPAAGRMVMVELPSLEAAHAWYASGEYARALAYRDRALRRRLVLVEGLPAGPR